MDAVGLAILERELAADAAVLRDASEKANLRLQKRAGGFAEAAGYELARFYTVIEKSFERVCLAFENHFEKRQNYHERLPQRMAIDLPGIRPAFVPAEELPALRDLKGFRHVIRHAYDLTLRPERLTDLAKDAARIADAFPAWSASFAEAVRRAQGWPEA